jgi:hypothetical protein
MDVKLNLRQKLIIFCLGRHGKIREKEIECQGRTIIVSALSPFNVAYVPIRMIRTGYDIAEGLMIGMDFSGMPLFNLLLLLFARAFRIQQNFNLQRLHRGCRSPGPLHPPYGQGQRSCSPEAA